MSDVGGLLTHKLMVVPFFDLARRLWSVLNKSDSGPWFVEASPAPDGTMVVPGEDHQWTKGDPWPTFEWVRYDTFLALQRKCESFDEVWLWAPNTPEGDFYWESLSPLLGDKVSRLWAKDLDSESVLSALSGGGTPWPSESWRYRQHCTWKEFLGRKFTEVFWSGIGRGKVHVDLEMGPLLDFAVRKTQARLTTTQTSEVHKVWVKFKDHLNQEVFEVIDTTDPARLIYLIHRSDATVENVPVSKDLAGLLTIGAFRGLTPLRVFSALETMWLRGILSNVYNSGEIKVLDHPSKKTRLDWVESMVLDVLLKGTWPQLVIKHPEEGVIATINSPEGYKWEILGVLNEATPAQANPPEFTTEWEVLQHGIDLGYPLQELPRMVHQMMQYGLLLRAEDRLTTSVKAEVVWAWLLHNAPDLLTKEWQDVLRSPSVQTAEGMDHLKSSYKFDTKVLTSSGHGVYVWDEGKKDHAWLTKQGPTLFKRKSAPIEITSEGVAIPGRDRQLPIFCVGCKSSHKTLIQTVKTRTLTCKNCKTEQKL